MTIKLFSSDGRELTVGDVAVFEQLVTDFAKIWTRLLPECDGLIDPPDARGLEDFVTGLVQQGLCESAGLRVLADHRRIAWGLHCADALRTAKVPYFKGEFVAVAAWPKLRLALMADDPLSEWESPEGVAQEVEYRERRDHFFRDRGWIVLNVNPNSGRLDEQIARIALIVKQAKLRHGRAS